MESRPTGCRHFALPAADHFAPRNASLQQRTLNKLHPPQCRPVCFGAVGAITQRIVEKNVKRMIGKLISTKLLAHPIREYEQKYNLRRSGAV
jgi:hypothetical protein